MSQIVTESPVVELKDLGKSHGTPVCKLCLQVAEKRLETSEGCLAK